MKVLTDRTAAALVRLLRQRPALPPRPARVMHEGRQAPTDTAVADASEDAPQFRSVEVRPAEEGSPAALELHGFDEPEPGASAGGALRLAKDENGGNVRLKLPDDSAAAGGADWTIAMRRTDPATGEREMVWATLDNETSDPSEDAPSGGGGGESAPPCGHPMNVNGGAGETTNPLDGPGDDPTLPGAVAENPLDHPGDGGYTPTCGGDPDAAVV